MRLLQRSAAVEGGRNPSEDLQPCKAVTAQGQVAGCIAAIGCRSMHNSSANPQVAGRAASEGFHQIRPVVLWTSVMPANRHWLEEACAMDVDEAWEGNIQYSSCMPACSGIPDSWDGGLQSPNANHILDHGLGAAHAGFEAGKPLSDRAKEGVVSRRWNRTFWLHVRTRADFGQKEKKKFGVQNFLFGKDRAGGSSSDQQAHGSSMASDRRSHLATGATECLHYACKGVPPDPVSPLVVATTLAPF
ncbi:hypothetical protein FB451DRAFT_1184428 [Mycena latifolia]|nr:hypothetical protein FB451DRAFT_1184428 [Mycena latifolia]